MRVNFRIFGDPKGQPRPLCAPCHNRYEAPHRAETRPEVLLVEVADNA